MPPMALAREKSLKLLPADSVILGKMKHGANGKHAVQARTAVCNCALVVVSADCEIRFADENARQWLKQFFGGGCQPGRLPRRLCHWLEQGGDSLGAPSLHARRGDAVLFVRPYRPHPPDAVPLLLEASNGRGKRTGVRAPRRHMGLTRRQYEVLRWVAAGKTNVEVGTILGISESTVANHMGEIIKALGVERRTAAANYYPMIKAYFEGADGKDGAEPGALEGSIENGESR